MEKLSLSNNDVKLLEESLDNSDNEEHDTEYERDDLLDYEMLDLDLLDSESLHEEFPNSINRRKTVPGFPS